MNLLNLFPMLALPLAMSCSKVVMTTAAILGATSPMDADPQGFEVAVTLPSATGVQNDGAHFIVGMENAQLDESFERTFILQQSETRDGKILFRVNPDDLDELRALQAKAKAWEMADPVASSGSISVFVSPCAIGDGPNLDDTFSVAMRTQVDGAFLPLIRGASIEDVVNALESENPQEDLKRLPQCKS